MLWHHLIVKLTACFTTQVEKQLFTELCFPLNLRCGRWALARLGEVRTERGTRWEETPPGTAEEDLCAGEAWLREENSFIEMYTQDFQLSQKYIENNADSFQVRKQTAHHGKVHNTWITCRASWPWMLGFTPRQRVYSGVVNLTCDIICILFCYFNSCQCRSFVNMNIRSY